MVNAAAFLLAQAETSPHVQFIYDLRAGHVDFVSPAYERVLGGRCARVNEELPALLGRLHPDDQAFLARCWQRWTRGQLDAEVEFRLLTPGEQDQWLQLTPSYFTDGAGGQWLGGQLRDISTPKHYKAHADRFNSRKNTLLEILSVDLADALVLTQRMRQDAEEAPRFISERLTEGLRRIQTLSRESVQLIHDFTNEEILTSSAVDLHLERVELGEKLRRALEDYHRPESAALHALTLELPEHPLYVLLDVNKFLQIPANLLSNAHKFTPDGGHIRVRLAAADGVARLTFADDGIGIPAELLPHVFERFTLARRPGLRGEPAIGQGLAICKQIAELHGGRIGVESVPDRGSTFTVEIPALPD